MSEDLQRGLGQAIRELRAKRKLSQQQLADAAGIHFTYLSGLERGKRNPSIEVIEQLAEQLGVSSSTLLRRAERFAAER